MKILMLGWELPPHNSGGLGVACYQLCKHLALQGVELDFAVPYQADHSDIDFMNIVESVPYDVQTMQALLGGAYESWKIEWQEAHGIKDAAGLPQSLREQQLRYVAFIKQHVKRNRYHVIHAHDWLTYEAAMAAKERLNVPMVAHVHATEFDRAGGQAGNPLVHDIEYTGLMMADRVIAVSQGTKDIIVQKYGIPADKVQVVYNSIDPTEFGPLPMDNTYKYLTHMKKRGYKVVVNVGRLTIQKGLTFLLEAAQQVVERNNKVLFVIAGSGEQYTELISRAAELGISQNILFTGFVRGKAWRDLYSIGDMFIMPSISEPFGLTALEAMGFGNAVLLSRQSGAGEILQHVLKFDFWDTHLMASQILALAEQPMLARELTRNAAREFSKMSWSDAAENCKQIYEGTWEPHARKQLWEVTV